MPLRAADWPQWRGPALNGSSPETHLPATLDPEKNLAWSVELPGPSAGTPILYGDKIYLSALERKTRNLLALCLDPKDGKVLWQREVAPGFTSNPRNDLAAPSPVTDGKKVIFLYGSGDVAAFDTEGKPLWQRNLQKDFGEFKVLFLYGATGLLHGDKYIVPVLHRADESYLLALDTNTGKDLWRVVRSTEARDESKEAYTTPMPYTREGKTEILLLGGDCVTGHDVETGKELWRVDGWNPNRINHWRIVPSPTVMNDLVVICPPKNGAAFAFKPGNTEWTWKNPELTSDVCAPLFYNGKLFILDGDKKRLSCADPATGKVEWTHELGGHAVFRASPTGADGKIYCINESGEVWVLSASEPKTLHQISLEGARARSTIVAAGGNVFVRTADKLFAFKSQ
jgi:outer membrane protein assembly factor BamB